MSVRVEQQGPVTTVIIDRPERRNAIDRETALTLREAFGAFEADQAALAAVLTGTGGTFCAGYDLKSVAESGSVDFYEPEGDGPMGPTRMSLSKPVIAAIEGHAVAGGLELALWCDLRIAAEDAVFGVFSRRWGVPFVDGGTVRLPRLIGQGRALDMFLTGRAVGATEALDWGLASRVVPSGQAREESERLAREIAAFPQLSLRADRRSVLGQWGLDLTQALRSEGRGGSAPLREETLAGARRFSARGRPETG